MGDLSQDVDVGDYMEEVPKHLSLCSVWRKGLLQRDKWLLQGVVLHGFQMLLPSSLIPKQPLGSPTPSHRARLRIPAWTWIFWCSVVRRSTLVSYLHSQAQRKPGNTWSSSSSGGMKGSSGPQAGRSCQPSSCPWRLKHKQPSTERTDPPETKPTVCYCSSFLAGLVPTTPRFYIF